MFQICRGCFGEIRDSNFVSISNTSDFLQIRTKLSVCIPEMIIDRIVNPILCSSCAASLQSAYEFKTRCLHTEKLIENYIKTMQLAKNQFTIEEIYNNIKQLNLPDLSNFSHTSTELLDDLNSLLDGVLENQTKVLDVPRDITINKVESKNNIIYVDIDESDLENDFYEDNQDEIFDSNITKECVVKLIPLPSELVKSHLNKNREKKLKYTKHDFSPDLQRNGKNKHIKCHFLTNTKTKGKIYVCKICNYKNDANLIKFQGHMRSHLKDYTCKICQKGYPCKSYLKQHMSVHTGDKPLACSLCSFKTAYRSNLHAHEKRFHGKNHMS